MVVSYIRRFVSASAKMHTSRVTDVYTYFRHTAHLSVIKKKETRSSTRQTWLRSACRVGACSSERDSWSEVFKDGLMKVGVACLAFFCGQDGNLK